MSTGVVVGTVLTIRTRDGKQFTGGVKALEKGTSIALQLYQPGPPCLKTLAWHDIASSAVVEPGMLQLNILKDQVLECYRQIFQCNFTMDMSRPMLSMASNEVRKDLENKIRFHENEIKVQKKLHKGLEPHLAALSEKDRQIIKLAVHHQQVASEKHVQQAQQQRQLHQQKVAAQSKKPVTTRGPAQSKPTPTNAKAAAVQQVRKPMSSASQQLENYQTAAAKKKKQPVGKAGKIGQLIKAMPADKQAGSKVMTKRKLEQLVAQIAPHEKLDEDVEDLLLDIADDFIESVTDFACLLARHRNSKVLEVKDVQLHLERNWNMRLPGFGQDPVTAPRKPVAEAHKQRLNQVRKAQLGADKK